MNSDTTPCEVPSSDFWETGGVEQSSEFQLIAELPSSAFFCVHVASRHGRKSVLKSVRPEYRQHALYTELLRKEYGILSTMKHPAIVEAEGLEEVPGLGLCLIMEYVEGRSLQTFLDSPSKKGMLLLRQLVVALDYIHSKGYVHRDIKPSNIMVLPDGEHLKIIDFGLADADRYLILKQAAGTEGYTSPEQQAGGEPDARNDIYSVGRIMQQMHLGQEYDSIIAKCLAPLPKRHTATTLLHDLDRMKTRHRLYRIGGATLTTLILLAVLLLWRQYNSVYRISTAQELMAYAALVNDGQDEKDAILTADINLEGCDWQPIGTLRHPFRRTFDGQGHHISHLVCEHPNQQFIGLFGIADGGSIVRRLILDANCRLSGLAFVGLVGGVYSEGTVTLEQLGNEGSVTAYERNAAGILGCVNGDAMSIHISDCYSTGDIRGPESTQICAWSGNYLSMSSCWSTSKLDQPIAGRGLVRMPSFKALQMRQCYTSYDQESDGSHSNVSNDEYLSGRLTFCLNDDKKEPVWFQTLGADSLPTFYTSSKRVYASLTRNCDGRLFFDSISNDPSIQHEVRLEHQYVNDICQREDCRDRYLEPKEDPADRYRVLTRPSHLMWFAQHFTHDARLDADIDLSDTMNVCIPLLCSTFHGYGHTITIRMDSHNENAALFQEINSFGHLRNLHVRGTIHTSATNAGGIAGHLSGKLTDCSSSVEIVSDVDGPGYHGGLCSTAARGAAIYNCTFSGRIIGPRTSACGGLIGIALDPDIPLHNCRMEGTLDVLPNRTSPFVLNPNYVKIENCTHK